MVSHISSSKLPMAAPAPSKILPGTVWGDVVDTIEGLKKQGNDVQRSTVINPLKYHRDQLNYLAEEQTKVLQDAVNTSKSLSGLSLGTFISSILYATSSIMGGCYLKACGRPEGDQFIQSGVVLLIHTVLMHQDGWSRLSRILSLGNQTVEQILTAVLPITMTLYTYAWNQRNLTQLPDDHRKKIESITTLLNIVNGAMQIGQIYLKFRQGQADRQLQCLDSEMNIKNLQVNQLLLLRGRIQDSFDSIGSSLRRVVKNMFYTTADSAKNI